MGDVMLPMHSLAAVSNRLGGLLRDGDSTASRREQPASTNTDRVTLTLADRPFEPACDTLLYLQDIRELLFRITYNTVGDPVQTWTFFFFTTISIFFCLFVMMGDNGGDETSDFFCVFLSWEVHFLSSLFLSFHFFQHVGACFKLHLATNCNYIPYFQG